jgi:putative ABC transport system permease protein
MSPSVAFLAAIFGGALCGLATAFQNVVLKVPSFVCGIVTTFAVTSINYRLVTAASNAFARAGRAVPSETRTELTLGNAGVFESAVQADLHNRQIGEFRLLSLLAVALVVLVLTAVVYFFMRSSTGLHLRAFGRHRISGSVYASRAPLAIYAGLMLSNALVCVSGTIFTQANKFASIDLGVGILIPLLAAIVLGEFFVDDVMTRLWRRLRGGKREGAPLVSRPFALTLAPCVGYLAYTVIFILIAVVVLPDYSKLQNNSKYWMTAVMISLILIYRRLKGRVADGEEVI